MRRVIIGLFIAATALPACSKSDADYLNTFNVDETMTTNAVLENDATAEVAAPPEIAPAHRWQFHEGDVYGYIAAVSEEQRKQGQAAGDVVMYVYRGFFDGADHLDNVDAAGRALSNLECARPCIAIKVSRYGGGERIAFNPASVSGAAFIDASNGKLIAVPRFQPEPPPSTQTTVKSDAPSQGPSEAPSEALPADENVSGLQ
jgi:hypothetical protein